MTLPSSMDREQVAATLLKAARGGPCHAEWPMLVAHWTPVADAVLVLVEAKVREAVISANSDAGCDIFHEPDGIVSRVLGRST